MYEECRISRISKITRMAGGLTLVPLSAFAQLPIVVSATVEINFGELSVATGVGGTAIISPAGGRSVTGGVSEVAGAGLEGNGVLSITASSGLAIDLSLTNATFTVDDGPGGGTAMNVTGFDIDGGGSSVTVTLTTFPQTFPIGATLNVNAGQLDGSYLGTYTVRANYQ
jgi:hypothetical protein